MTAPVLRVPTPAVTCPAVCAGLVAWLFVVAGIVGLILIFVRLP